MIETKTLKAVLFDVDDTLLDWSQFDSDWTTMEASRLGGVFDYIHAEVHPLSDLEAYTNEFHKRTIAAWTAAREGHRAPNITRVLIETAGSFGVPSDKIDPARVMATYNWGVIPTTTVFPEVHDVMVALRDAGIKIGVVTNAYQPMAMREIEMRGHGILDYFPDCRVSAADVGYLKPHPEIFETALRLIGTSAAETVFVGDDPHADIVGAQGMGMKAVLRYTPRRPFEHGDDDIHPDAIIKDLTELSALLDQWYPGWKS